jgi:hypothetical protein
MYSDSTLLDNKMNPDHTLNPDEDLNQTDLLVHTEPNNPETVMPDICFSFPDVFDREIYKQNNPDLQFMNNDELSYHYNQYGKQEGRICSLLDTRVKLTHYIPEDSSCLEIEPFDEPFLTLKNVTYFDVLNKEDLIEKSKKLERNADHVPDIDYVSNTRDLTIINKKFNLILSSHSIQFQTNFIKHINDVSSLLTPNGVYVIICPDKRYCFDHFIGESTIADIIQMQCANNEKHTVKSVIEHRALTCHNEIDRHWNGDHGEQNLSNLQNAIDEYNSDKHVDVHSLQFTPSSFENIIHLLITNNLIDMYCDKVYPTLRNSNEFFVILRKKDKIEV